MAGISQQIRFAVKYLRHWLIAQTRNDVHSPFVFEFVEKVLRNKNHFYPFDRIESLRAKLILSSETIEVTDFGAGSLLLPGRKKKISFIARHFAKSPEQAQLLFRMANYFQSGKILEIGTSLGISTLYLALSDSNKQVITLEGCPQTASAAQKNFDLLKAGNIEIRIGNFDFTLDEALKKIHSVDFVFFDGNHRMEPTWRYFLQCLEFSNPDSVFVFDDIHWSEEMETAWEAIKAHPSVKTTIDLFFMGIVFFKEGHPVQHFALRY